MKRFSKMVSLLFMCFIFGPAGQSQAQDTITLWDCHEAALSSSTLQERILNAQAINDLRLGSLETASLPSLTINGQGTYQSDVFQIPFAVPGFDAPLIPKEQFKLSLDFYQSLYNGGNANYQRQIQLKSTRVEQSEVEVSLYEVQNLINRIYYGALMAQEAEAMASIAQQNLQGQLKNLQALQTQGAAMTLSLRMLRKEILILEQKIIEARDNKSAALAMLRNWTELELSDDVVLDIPQPEFASVSDLQSRDLSRPELRLLDHRADLLSANRDQLKAVGKPKVGVFGTAGVGYPNPFDPFTVDVSPFYLVGLKLSWNVIDWNRNTRESEVLEIRQKSLSSQKGHVEKSIRTSMTSDYGDLAKYQDLIEIDNEILQIQREIISQSRNQLDNGVITTTEYLTEVNKGLQAERSLKIHELELSKSWIELLTKSGEIENYKIDE